MVAGSIPAVSTQMIDYEGEPDPILERYLRTGGGDMAGWIASAVREVAESKLNGIPASPLVVDLLWRLEHRRQAMAQSDRLPP